MHEKNPQLPNPLTLAHFVRSTSPLWGEVKLNLVLAVYYAGVCEFNWQMIERFLYALRSIRSSLFPFPLAFLFPLQRGEAKRRQTPIQPPRLRTARAQRSAHA
jgi:hypothetical protein